MFKQFIFSMFGALSVTAFSAPLLSAQTSLCDAPLDAKMIEGLVDNWSTTVLSGLIEQGGTTVALPPGQLPTFETTIALIGDRLLVTIQAEGATAHIPLEPAQQEWDLTARADGNGPAMDEKDLGYLMDCEANRLPRLSGSAESIDGGWASASLFLYMLNPDFLYGVLHVVSPDGLHLRESVTISR